jgi:hypoxanthine phosphoribosyltransferase
MDASGETRTEDTERADAGQRWVDVDGADAPVAGVLPLVPLFSEGEIAGRVRTLARMIARDYRGRDLVLVGVLTGAFMFMADLVRALHRSVAIDFVALSSYGSATDSSGIVTITKGLKRSVRGRHVVVVEDILDTGHSMKTLLEYLETGSPASVRVCALVDKVERRVEAVHADYVGFTVGEGFVVGYGIDVAEQYRELPAIYRLAAGGVR